MTGTDPSLNKLLFKLGKYYWTPVHPSHYVYREKGAPKGLGVLAHLDYGLFNLTWSVFPLATPEQHARASAFFVHHLGKMPDVAGANLSDWLTLLTPQEFSDWHKKAYTEIPADYNQIINLSLDVLGQVQYLRR
jgi:hypothetical protein